MRPTKDIYFLRMANLVATRSTCLRRSVGCVLVNHRGHVLATGYNGVAAGQPHCNLAEPTFEMTGFAGEWAGALDGMVDYPHACEGAESPSGSKLDKCKAIHAEQNALLQCKDVFEIHTCYVTLAPCELCVKLLLNTGCTRIVFSEEHYHTEGRDLWMEAVEHRRWEHIPTNRVLTEA